MLHFRTQNERKREEKKRKRKGEAVGYVPVRTCIRQTSPRVSIDRSKRTEFSLRDPEIRAVNDFPRILIPLRPAAQRSSPHARACVRKTFFPPLPSPRGSNHAFGHAEFSRRFKPRESLGNKSRRSNPQLNTQASISRAHVDAVRGDCAALGRYPAAKEKKTTTSSEDGC